MYEALLDPTRERVSLDTIEYPDMYALFEKHKKSFWTAGEVSFVDDVGHWNDRLNEDERSFFKHILQFFAASDYFVAKNCASNFRDEVSALEHKFFYDFQAMMENEHSIVYGNMIKALVPEPEERACMFNAVQTHPFIKRKIDWVLSYMSRDIPFQDRVVAMACMEGIFFSASFCTIFWLKHRGLMPGLCQANEWISRDESLHTQAGCLVHRQLMHPSTRTLDIVRSAVALECDFVEDALQGKQLPGLSVDEVCRHVKYVADVVLGQLGMPPEYGVEEPFEWMVLMTAPLKENFFESRVTSYSRPQLKRLRSSVMTTADIETILCKI